MNRGETFLPRNGAREKMSFAARRLTFAKSRRLCMHESLIQLLVVQTLEQASIH